MTSSGATTTNRTKFEEEKRSKIPQWEKTYYQRQRKCGQEQQHQQQQQGENNVTDDCLKVVETPEKGKHLMATRDIEDGEVILTEDALMCCDPDDFHPSLLTKNNKKPSKTTTTDGATTTTTRHNHDEFHRLIEQCAKHTKVYGPNVENWPPNSPQQKDRFRLANVNDEACLLNATASAAKGGESTTNEPWKLEDSTREAEIGDVVMIDGPLSVQGQKLNGMIGNVIKADEKDSTRLGVHIEQPENQPQQSQSSSEPASSVMTMRSIKRCNLKTLHGMAKTNSYGAHKSSHTHMSSLCCRLNHGCMDAADVWLYSFSDLRKSFVLARKPIKRGEEILYDCVSNEISLDKRRQSLQEKYKFWCTCPMHGTNPPVGPFYQRAKMMEPLQQSQGSDGSGGGVSLSNLGDLIKSRLQQQQQQK